MSRDNEANIKSLIQWREGVGVNTNMLSRELEPEIAWIVYREAVMEAIFKRCMVSIVGKVRRDDYDCDSAVAIGFTNVCEDDCFKV